MDTFCATVCCVVDTQGVDVGSGLAEGLGDGAGVPYTVNVCVSDPVYAKVSPEAVGFGAGVAVGVEVGCVGSVLEFEPPPPQAESAITVSGRASKPKRAVRRNDNVGMNLHENRSLGVHARYKQLLRDRVQKECKSFRAPARAVIGVRTQEFLGLLE